MKHIYQRLSDVPGLNTVPRNSRAGEFDQRLRDDIGGLSTGKVIVADLMLAMEIPYGDQNTPVHEAAHQFHNAGNQTLKACITELYNAAKARNNNQGLFSVGYASTNEAEYFAMAVQHYVIPEDAPSFMGVNRGWYLNNDKRAFLLVQMIEQANGDMNKINRCPAATEAAPLAKVDRNVFVGVIKGADGTGQYLAAKMPPEVEEAYYCTGHEIDCRNGLGGVTKLIEGEFAQATTFWVGSDLKLQTGEQRSVVVLGKAAGSSKFTHVSTVTVTGK